MSASPTKKKGGEQSGGKISIRTTKAERIPCLTSVGSLPTLFLTEREARKRERARERER